MCDGYSFDRPAKSAAQLKRQREHNKRNRKRRQAKKKTQANQG